MSTTAADAAREWLIAHFGVDDFAGELEALLTARDEACAAVLDELAAAEQNTSVIERAKGDDETAIIYARYAAALRIGAAAIRARSAP